MGNSFSQNDSKKYMIPKNGDPYITSKIFKYVPSKKNNEINQKKIPYITSKFLRASL